MAVLTMLLVSVVLTACFIPAHVPSNEEIVGEWVHSGPKGEETRLSFSSDGTFELKHVPRVLLEPVRGPATKLNWRDVLDITGEWYVGGLDGGEAYLAVNFDRTASYAGSFGSKIRYEGSAADPLLYLWVGPTDESPKFTFVPAAG